MAKKGANPGTAELGTREKCGYDAWKKPKLIQYDKWKHRHNHFRRPDWPEGADEKPHPEALEYSCTCGQQLYRPAVQAGSRAKGPRG